MGFFKKHKDIIHKITSILLDIFIFIALAYTLFSNFVDAIFYNPQNKILILIASTIVSILLPTITLVLLHEVEKEQAKRELKEIEIEVLKKENEKIYERLEKQLIDLKNENKNLQKRINELKEQESWQD